MNPEEILPNFRNERYELLNAARWKTFLGLNIPVRGRTIFEPGAGVGDQTQWLLAQGARRIYVNDGRESNLDIIRERFKDDARLCFLPGALEECLTEERFGFEVDLIFCWGVYYHLRESFPEFHIMRALRNLGRVIVFDYLAGEDNEVSYGYDNPSASLTTFAFRPKPETMAKAVRDIWGHCYLPIQQLKWVDPVQAETRLIMIGSREPLIPQWMPKIIEVDEDCESDCS